MSQVLYLPFDTETGGLGDNVSLLSAHFAVCDEHMNMLDELNLFMKPNDGYYIVNAEALAINKIDLISHDATAATYTQAGSMLREFLWKHSNNGKVKLIPVGKNVVFDIQKVNANILNAKSWNHFVSYRLYDITGLVVYLKRKGKLPKDAPDSLEGLSNYFNIPIDAHTARGDNLAQIALLQRLESL